MSKQDREITEADALEPLQERVEVARELVREVVSELRRTTGAGIDPEKALALRTSLLELRRGAWRAALTTDDLRRRAANPRDGGES